MKPITDANDLHQLDDEELISGYLAGFKGNPDYTKTNQSYWHGYLNGEVDSGRQNPSVEQLELAKSAVDSGYFKDLFQTRQ